MPPRRPCVYPNCVPPCLLQEQPYARCANQPVLLAVRVAAAAPACIRRPPPAPNKRRFFQPPLFRLPPPQIPARHCWSDARRCNFTRQYLSPGSTFLQAVPLCVCVYVCVCITGCAGGIQKRLGRGPPKQRAAAEGSVRAVGRGGSWCGSGGCGVHACMRRECSRGRWGLHGGKGRAGAGAGAGRREVAGHHSLRGHGVGAIRCPTWRAPRRRRPRLPPGQNRAAGRHRPLGRAGGPVPGRRARSCGAAGPAALRRRGAWATRRAAGSYEGRGLEGREVRGGGPRG